MLGRPRQRKRSLFSKGPFVGDRLKDFITCVANHNGLRCNAGKRGAEAREIVREELWIGFRCRSDAGDCARAVEEPGEPGEVFTLPGVMKTRDKHSRLLRRLLVHVCKHTFEK